jgi:hypothetical protein
MNEKVKWALSTGIVFAFGTLVLGLLATFFGWGMPIVDLFGTGYLGYQATIVGSLIGAIWAFADAFIGIYLIIWVYERFE